MSDMYFCNLSAKLCPYLTVAEVVILLKSSTERFLAFPLDPVNT